jgi:predicted Zn-dependent peptidase
VPSYPLDHPDRYALQLLSTILGTGMSSRLFTEVRERRGLAYYIYAINHSYTTSARSSRRRVSTSIASTRRSRPISDELKKITDEAVRPTSSRRRERREGAVRAPDREPARA